MHCFTFSIGKKRLAVNLYPAQKSGRDFEYAVYRGDRMRGLPNYVFQASHLQRRCYAVGKFRGAFRAKKSGVPLYLPMLLPTLFVSAKILYEASKILAKKLLPFCHASKQKDPLFSCTVCAWYGLCRGTAAGLHSKQGQPQILLRKLSGLWGIRPSTAFTGAENFPAKKSFPPGVRLT